MVGADLEALTEAVGALVVGWTLDELPRPAIVG